MTFGPPARVVIAGAGVVTPFGAGMERLRRGLFGESPSVFVARAEPRLSFPLIRAPIPTDAIDNGLAELRPRPPGLVEAAGRAARRADAPIRAVVVAALEAWADAGFSDAPPPEPERTALLLATQSGTLGARDRLERADGDSLEWVSPAWGLGFMDSRPLGILSEILGLRGEGATVGAASASGTAALIQAARLIRSGEAAVCVVAAPPADLSPVEFQALRNLGALGGAGFADRPDQACRPFDAGADGFIPGESAAAVVLESEASARARGRFDGAPRLDGWASALSASSGAAPDGETEFRVMRDAMTRAGLTPAGIGCVSAHATSTPLGDRVEGEAIRRLLDGVRVPVNAPKGHLGHGLWSAGLVEAAGAVLQLREGRAHGNRNLDRPAVDGLQLQGTEPRVMGARAILSNGFGFGGIHTSVVFTGGGA